jgi:DNA-directed RNA polymerase specialized sigma subunit
MPKYPPVDPELVARAKKNGCNGDDFNLLLEATFRLVTRVASQYRWYGLEDARWAGKFGVCTAVRKFDPGRGTPFEKFAYYEIRKEIQRAAFQGLALPQRDKEQLDALLDAEAEFFAANGREATRAELTASLDCDPEELDEVLKLRSMMEKRNFDRYVRRDGNEHIQKPRIAPHAKWGRDLAPRIVRREALKALIRMKIFLREENPLLYFLITLHDDFLSEELGPEPKRPGRRAGQKSAEGQITSIRAVAIQLIARGHYGNVSVDTLAHTLGTLKNNFFKNKEEHLSAHEREPPVHGCLFCDLQGLLPADWPLADIFAALQRSPD